MIPANDLIKIKREKISFSEQSAWRNCPHRWYLEHVDPGVRREIYSIDMSFGTAVHHALEHLKHRSLDKRATLDQTFTIFEVKMFEEHEKIKSLVSRPYDLDQYLLFGRGILEHIDDVAELRDGEVVFNELPLYEKIDRTDGLDVSFKGFVDIVIRVKGKRGGKSLLYVCDFKTCRWGWDRKKRQDPEVHRQLFLYKHFLCKKYGLDPKDVRTAFILLKKAPPDKSQTVEFLPISAGPVPMARAVEALQQDVGGMASGIHPKNRLACRSGYEPCPHIGTPLCPDD